MSLRMEFNMVVKIIIMKLSIKYNEHTKVTLFIFCQLPQEQLISNPRVTLLISIHSILEMFF